MADVRRFYAAASRAYAVPAHLIVREMAIPLSKSDPQTSWRDAADLAGRARRGEVAFASLARSFSKAPSAPLGGALDPVSAGTVPQVVWQALSALEPGGISEPIELDGAIHLYQLVRGEPERTVSFEQALPDVIATLKRTRLASANARMATAAGASAPLAPAGTTGVLQLGSTPIEGIPAGKTAAAVRRIDPRQ